MKRTVCIFMVVAVLCCLLPVSAGAVEVAGKSAVLLDVTTGTVLYAKNEHQRLHPASVTKVMTMLLIMEAIDGRRDHCRQQDPQGRQGDRLCQCRCQGRKSDLFEGK